LSTELEKAPERWINLFGLVVVTKTDVLAAVAFVLALWSASYSFYGYARGAVPTLYHPETIYIYFDKYADSSRNVRLAGEISLTNSGAEGRNTILREVSTRVTIEGAEAHKRTFEEKWNSFVKVSRRGTVLSIDPSEAARPVVMEGGGAVSQMVSFAPVPVDCATEKSDRKDIGEADCDTKQNFVQDNAFLIALSKATRINVDFIGTILGTTRPLTSTCYVLVTENLMAGLYNNDWFAARCFSSEK
jgi:hypothetical protein